MFRISGRHLHQVLAVVALGLLLAACGNDPAHSRLSEFGGPAMGTFWNVKVVDLPAGLEGDAVREMLEEELADISLHMSTYDEDSELSRFNRQRDTGWTPASAGLVEVLTAALQVSELSAGAFDVTVGPLVNLWGFGPDEMTGALPTEAEIEAALARTGYTRLAVRPSPPAIRKEIPDLYVDLSAIAKGYAVDRLAARLEDSGIANYLVDIGGELRGKGLNHREEPWRIGIERPSVGERAVYAVIALNDAGVATSGDYRNYIEQQGQRYSHTIDAHTGRPVTHRLASVTVISETAMWADAMATALMVLGPEAGYSLAEREGLAAYFIYRDGDGFADRETPEFIRHRQARSA